MTDHANAKPEATPDITPIRRLIGRTVRLLRSSWVATGLGMTVGLALGTLVLLALLDLGIPLWTWFRLLALAIVVVPATLAFVAGVIRPLMRRLRPAQVARRIESHLPGIHNRLVSCIDLDAKGGTSRTQMSPEFYRRLVREALERIKDFHPRTVVDGRRLRRAGLFATTSVLAFALAFGLFSDRMPTALARIFSPFADIPPASGVRYTVEPGTTKQLRGDDITFKVHVEAGDPDRLTLDIEPDSGTKPLRYDLQKRDAHTWTFTLSGFESSFGYRVRGGGTWTRRDRITMIDRPTLVNLHTVLHYPDYMGQPEPRVGPPQTADVTGPEGSTVEVVVGAEGDVAVGEIQLLEAHAGKVEVALADRPERPWFQERLPDGAHADGRWDWDLRLLGRPTHNEPAAPGPHEHSFHSASAPFPVRAGESLFALVYIKPGQMPESIMLGWHDGSGWEHRAYWGADKFTQGKAGTPSRTPAGPLPKAGEWVRLEVPARAVDLEGKTVRGMSFATFGGQCDWHRAGAVPSSHRETQELRVARRFPMESAGPGRWSGRFPLDRDSLYRVELRNELGFASKAMRQAKATAIPDNPPQVVLERPGTDLTLSEPAKVPLSIAAYDDFGLADIVVSTQKGDSGGFVGRPVKHYPQPRRSESLTAALDLKAMELKPGEHVRYRVEARDRKGQSAQTQEFVVRIAANDGNAADKQLENYEKGQDSFRENLVKLIAEQAKVQETVKAMTAKYAPLEAKLEAAEAAAEAEARPAPEGAPKANDPKAAAKDPVKLDPEAAKQLAELRQELAQLAAKEQQNTEVGKQVEAGLKQAAEQAAKLQMIPAEMMAQIDRLPQAFQDRVLEPLQELAAEMKQGADAGQPAPDLAQIEHQADRVQEELNAVKEQLEAAAAARKEVPQDVDNAVARLREEMLRQNADLTARDLADLQEFLKGRAEELKRLEGRQEQLAEATPVVPDVLLPDLEKKQAELDAQEEAKLAEARRLLDAERLRAMRRDDPQFPDAPYVPEPDEQAVPPKEEDPDAPADAKSKAKAEDAADEADSKEEAAKKEDGADEAGEDPLFMPALGGPKPKLDPRFADKLRPLPPRDAAKGDHPEDDAARQRRDELGSRQQQRLAELDTARQSLASDEHTLESLVRSLREALQGQSPEEAQATLNRLMRDPAMRQAIAMARRRGQAPPQNQNPNAPNPPPPPGPTATDRADLFPTTDAVGSPQAAELAKLDLATRTVILKMPPRLREDLLQGLREEGPEGYHGFIRDYFQRLTKVKGAP